MVPARGARVADGLTWVRVGREGPVGGGSDPGPSKEGFEEVTWEVGRVLYRAPQPPALPFLVSGDAIPVGAASRSQVGVESDPEGA